MMIPSLYLDGDMQAVLIFQFSATLLAIGLTRWLPLPPSIQQHSLGWLDYLSFAMFAIGTALLCAFLVLGNINPTRSKSTKCRKNLSRNVGGGGN